MKTDLKSPSIGAARKLLTDLAQNQRRLALLKRSQMFSGSMLGAKAGRATDIDDLRQAFRLVHDSFVGQGFIKPVAGGLRIRHFEAAGETATFVAKKDEDVVGVLGFIIDSPDLGLPSDVAFRPELDEMRRKGMKLMEGTNQTVVPAFRKSAVAMELIRCGGAHALMHRCDMTVVAISPRHAPFYEVLGFTRGSDVRSYSKDFYDPVILMCMSTHAAPGEADNPCLTYARNFLFWDNPYRKHVHVWEEAALRSFRDPDLLRDLLVVSSDTLRTCTPAQLEAIRSRWGQRLFAEVAGDSLTPTGRSPEGHYMSANRARVNLGG